MTAKPKVGELFIATVDCKDHYFRKGDLLLCCDEDTIKDTIYGFDADQMIHTAINITQNKHDCYFYDNEVEPAS